MNSEIIKTIFDWQKDPTNELYIKPEEFEIEPIKGYKDGVKKRDGLLVFNAVINMSMAKNLTLRPDDTFIIGYPKSGKIL